MLLIHPVAEHGENGIAVPKRNRVPDHRRHHEGEIAAIERENSPAAAIVAADIDGAMHADHELRAEPVRMMTPLGALRRAQHEQTRDGEGYMLHAFRRHHLAVVSGVAGKLQETGIGNEIHQGTCGI